MTVLAIALILFLDFVIIAGSAFLILSITGWRSTGVPFVPSSSRVLPALIKALELTSESTLYDLGSGDGKVLYALARAVPGARYMGAEKALLPYFFSFGRRLLAGMPAGAQVLRKDFDELSLSDATHVYLYLFPELMDRLLPKLAAELAPGSRVVACDFAFSERPHDQEIRTPGRHTLYVYHF